MQTPIGHLIFCTNIFPGETWEMHFDALKKNIPLIKGQISPYGSFGIGLRLSNKASLKLSNQASLAVFKRWLLNQDCYIFAINGFPYGNFHGTRVKDKVHIPDWTTNDRLQYTLRLIHILSSLLPMGMDGSISTSPLSYKHWFTAGQSILAVEEATRNIVEVICVLINIHKNTGKILHIDIEPEADGLIESSSEFLDWFQRDLMCIGTSVLRDRLALSESESATAIREHIRLCYDICHFAVGFEETVPVLEKLKLAGIEIGRWQLSAALKIPLRGNKREKEESLKTLKKFDEPVYLHQVVAQQQDSSLLRYADISDALSDGSVGQSEELRSHFHVPLFIKEYGLLQSTQEDVKKVISLQKKNPVCNILEVETYTWGVLPHDLSLPLAESIIREMKWVLKEIES